MKSILDYQKVAILGRPGSGKTTLALELSKKMNIPVYHLDRHLFIENWQDRPLNEFLAIQKEIISKPRWIIDGNAIHSLEPRYAMADLILYLTLPRIICLWRAFYRVLQRRLKKFSFEDRAEGCKEILRWKFIRYLWHFDSLIFPELTRLKNKYPHIPFIFVSGKNFK